MELRTYWAIVWRRRWLALGVAVVTFITSLAIQTYEPPAYDAVVQLALNPNLPLTQGDYSPAQHYYYENLNAEYLNDDIIEIAESESFLKMVQDEASRALNQTVNGTIEGEKTHKLLFITATATQPEQALAMANVIMGQFGDPQGKYYKMLVSYNPTITLTDQVRAEPSRTASRALIYLALRVVLGLVAGLGLAFLLEYLDDSVRSARDVETITGLPVLAEIPPSRAKGAAPTRPDATGRPQVA